MLMDPEALTARGWVLVERVTNSAPQFEVWRLGREPFCVELELWGKKENQEIRGRLAAPGIQVQGNMIFTKLPSIPEAVSFLERLLEGATRALLPNGG